MVLEEKHRIVGYLGSGNDRPLRKERTEKKRKGTEETAD